MTIAGLAPSYQGRLLLPVLGKVTATRYTDRVRSGWSPGSPRPTSPSARRTWLMGSARCCAGSAPPGPGPWCWSSSAVTPWPPSSPPCPVPAHVDFKALPVGRREDGLPWLVRLHGTHVLLAGSTGAGKASLLWAPGPRHVPARATGLVRVPGR